MRSDIRNARGGPAERAGNPVLGRSPHPSQNSGPETHCALVTFLPPRKMVRCFPSRGPQPVYNDERSACIKLELRRLSCLPSDIKVTEGTKAPDPVRASSHVPGPPTVPTSSGSMTRCSCCLAFSQTCTTSFHVSSETGR